MATYIRKYNYFIGAFLYHIINKVIKPAMIFDCSESAKIIQFETNAGKYNTFVKYCCSPSTKADQKTKRMWNFSFTANEIEEMEKLNNYNGNRYIVLVCAELSLTSTEIAVIDINEAKSCLGDEQNNKNKRITIVSNKNSHSLLCYGSGDKHNVIKINRSLDKHFK